ncbi:MAG: phosphoenolpyruvate synthase, partial [Actinomycetota bacterium]|nr:phosphoenolpyruvate synthase [Actinomycetota bacterium]
MTPTRPEVYVRGLDEIDETDVAVVGGKGVNLATLSRLDGVRVPHGFCVTTDAYVRATSDHPRLDEQLERLGAVTPEDRDAICSISAEVRDAIMTLVVPPEIVSAISGALHRGGDGVAYAVRSSATAEDLPTASFAGQHDSHLNVVGESAIVDHVRRCWASLFTERAVAYRQRQHIDHRAVTMAVVVQQMVDADASGVMFTADPVSSDRTVVAVEACLGLGEALVSGTVDPDVFTVRGGEIVERSGVTLTDEQVVALAELGRSIEDHFGAPQDIEWCRIGDQFWIVQSRPITTLFPVPPSDDDANHVYVSVGHQQMMTDAMTPLGLSIWQMTTPAPMAEAGGRLFVDVTARLASPTSRAALIELFGQSDPLLGDAIRTVLDRGDVPVASDEASPPPPVVGASAELDADPAVVVELMAESAASIAECRRAISTTSGSQLFEFIASDMQELRRLLFDPRSHQVFMTAMDATRWINEHVLDWLGDKNVADALTQSVPHNVTSEMGLALLDVSDVVRRHPAVVEFLRGVDGDDTFLDDLVASDGGPEVRAAIDAFLDRYGMRCAGEIDITRPRWKEQPTALVPLILAHVETMQPGEAARRFERGRREAHDKEIELLERVRELPNGEEKAATTAAMIDRVRTFIGYREFPKYAMVSRYSIYKEALWAEAGRLVDAGVIRDRDDTFYLRFDELHEVVRAGHVDRRLIDRRRDDFRSYETLAPPRVLTSNGEALNGTYRRDDVPDGALPGLAVSSGTVEGRARVVLDISDADVEPGDILVTAYTDPS